MNKVFNRELFFHPLNIILLFIINTSTQKIKAGLTTGFLEPTVAFIIILSISVLIFFLINRFIKNAVKASILLTYFLLVTLFFRDIVELLIYSGISEALSFIGDLLLAIIIGIILGVVLSKWLSKTKHKLTNLNSYLNLLTTIFLIVEIVGCSTVKASRLELKENVKLEVTVSDTIKKPDVYFILLDGYTGFHGLKKLWKYDNSELEKFLQENNFFFAKNGKSVYNVTNYSIASTFNMSEIIFDTTDLYDKSNFLTLANFIKHNPVVRFFHQSGYEFINLSFWEMLNKNKFYQDIYFLRRGNIYQARTIYGHLFEIWNEQFADMAEINPGIFKQVKKISSVVNDKPKFVYAHIMMPHPPYYFDAEGNKKELSYFNDGKNMHKYLEQLKYTNKLLMKTLKSILDSALQPPIIIVQSDHGFRSYEGADKLEIEHSVLNCLYFPDKDYSMLNDSSKTINTFRIIFNKYFNQNLKLIN